MFPNIQIQYWFESDTEYHIIIIDNFTYNNKDYILEEVKVWEEFHRLFPTELILISNPKHSLNNENTKI